MDTSRYKIEFEDGSTIEVVSDQRDIAKWECMPFGTSWAEAPNKLFTFSRFRAWSAARRAKVFTDTWEEFGEVAVEVSMVDEDGESPDPGQSAASAES